MKIAFMTYGCRLNQAETEDLKEEATRRGLFLTDIENAEVIIVNSCCVTSKAQSEVEKFLRNPNHKNKKIILTGCAANEKLSNLAEIYPNKDKDKIFEKIAVQSPNKIPDPGTKNMKTRLNIKIQEGCNNFCAYCIVPFVRGREKSISFKKIIQKCKEAEAQEIQEIILTGVNIGKYYYEGKSLADLLRSILLETNIPRIRISSINPEDIDERLILLWKENKRLCRHFHLSLQSGSDSVLKRMKRNYNTEFYRSLVKNMKNNIRGIIFTTDLIVGFPGETEREFQETLNFIKSIGFLKVHVFRYSKREGTVAASFADQITEKVKTDRARILSELEKQIRTKILKDQVGKSLTVLFEKKKNGKHIGLADNYIKVSAISATDISNKFIRAKITDSDSDFLYIN